MTENTKNLNHIGFILYETINEKELLLLEIKTVFNLRKAKLKNKNRKQSKIFSLDNKQFFIYIQELDKWYYNKVPFQNQDKQVKLYDTITDIENLKEFTDNQLNAEVTLNKNELIRSGYLVYDFINYNYIECKEYKSQTIMRNDEFFNKKQHHSELFKLSLNSNIKYIKELDQWYYNSKNNLSIERKIQIYNTFEDIPLKNIIDKENQIEKTVEKRFKKDYNDEHEFRSKNINRLNIRTTMKDLKFIGYILYEFTTINHIKYEIFNTHESAVKKINSKNTISKLFSKKSDENIFYLKSINKWFNKLDNTNKIYDSEIDIPKKNTQQQEITYEKKKNHLKQLVKKRNLLFKGWIYYEKINDSEIKAKHYYSSNQLLTRLNKNKGSDSEFFISKSYKEIAYIKNINKWYFLDNDLEKKDVKIKIYDEEEIFKNLSDF